MNFQSYYEPYCSSWLKFGGAIISLKIAASLSKDSIIAPIISAAYHAHNLYAEYQYNKSLEAELTVEIKGEIHTVKASPTYFNWYTAYNALFAVSQIIQISFCKARQDLHTLEQYAQQYARGDVDFVDGQQRISELHKVLLPIIGGIYAALVCKLISLQDDYLQYNFTDMKTGMSISPEEMEYVKVLDVKYINAQDEKYSESPIDDPMICDHTDEFEVDHPVMAAAD
jgi:hypothetical protein